jgi:hypothetical protein
LAKVVADFVQKGDEDQQHEQLSPPGFGFRCGAQSFAGPANRRTAGLGHASWADGVVAALAVSGSQLSRMVATK